eukprot:GEMP01005467.1.p1 GENE.GEMP01005467.1~~GEMP01005467.1.p1  ORF type:complete len:949 (+),score=151.24 GEMP01005467.1:81-2849(+)
MYRWDPKLRDAYVPTSDVPRVPKAGLGWLSLLDVDQRAYGSIRSFPANVQAKIRETYTRNRRRRLKGILVAIRKVTGRGAELACWLDRLNPSLTHTSVKALLNDCDQHPELLGKELLGEFGKLNAHLQESVVKRLRNRFANKKYMDREVLREELIDMTQMVPAFKEPFEMPYLDLIMTTLSASVQLHLLEAEGNAVWKQICKHSRKEQVMALIDSIRDADEQGNELLDHLLEELHKCRRVNPSIPYEWRPKDIEKAIDHALSLVSLPSLTEQMKRRLTLTAQEYDFIDFASGFTVVNLRGKGLDDARFLNLLTPTSKAAIWDYIKDGFDIDLTDNDLTCQSMEYLYRFLHMLMPRKQKRLRRLLLSGNNLGDADNNGCKWLAALLYHQHYGIEELDLDNTMISTTGLATILLSISQHPLNSYPLKGPRSRLKPVLIRANNNPIAMTRLVREFQGEISPEAVDEVTIAWNGHQQELLEQWKRTDPRCPQINVEFHLKDAMDSDNRNANGNGVWREAFCFVEGLFLDDLITLTKLEKKQQEREEKMKAREDECAREATRVQDMQREIIHHKLRKQKYIVSNGDSTNGNENGYAENGNQPCPLDLETMRRVQDDIWNDGDDWWQGAAKWGKKKGASKITSRKNGRMPEPLYEPQPPSQPRPESATAAVPPQLPPPRLPVPPPGLEEIQTGNNQLCTRRDELRELGLCRLQKHYTDIWAPSNAEAWTPPAEYAREWYGDERVGSSTRPIFSRVPSQVHIVEGPVPLSRNPREGMLVDDIVNPTVFYRVLNDGQSDAARAPLQYAVSQHPNDVSSARFSSEVYRVGGLLPEHSLRSPQPGWECYREPAADRAAHHHGQDIQAILEQPSFSTIHQQTTVQTSLLSIPYPLTSTGPAYQQTRDGAVVQWDWERGTSSIQNTWTQRVSPL